MSSIQLQIYDFAMAAGGSFPLPVAGSYFRILTTTGDVDVIGDTFGRLGPISRGQGLADKQYGRLTIQDKSGAPNSGTILVSDANFIDQTLYGSIALATAVDLSASTLAALEEVKSLPQTPSASYSVAASLAAATAVQVFSAASNPNGAIVLAAGCSTDASAGDPSVTLISKATAPANIHDGNVYLRNEGKSQGSSWQCYSATLPGAVLVPPGHGLFWISSLVTPAGSTRNVLYTLR